MSHIIFPHGQRYRPVDRIASATKRFWSKVDKAGTDDCWPWIGGRCDKGYGMASWVGERKRATHIALMLDGRPKPHNATGNYVDEPLALHACDNPACVNPKHLRWGTSAENAHEREERTYGREGAQERGMLQERAIKLYDGGMSLLSIAKELGLPNAAKASQLLAMHRGEIAKKSNPFDIAC